MSYALPLSGSPQREMFAIEDLIAIGRGDVSPIDLPQAKRQARRMFAAQRAIKRVCFIVMRADDEMQLISIGRRLAHRVEWRFGPYQGLAR